MQIGLSQIDPRAKLCWFVSSSLSVVFIGRASGLLIVASSLLVLVLMTRKSSRDVELMSLGLVWWVVFTSLAVGLWMVIARPPSAEIISFFVLVLRIAILGGIAIVFFRGTNCNEIIDGLILCRVPKSAALAYGVAVRFLPLVIGDARRILLAQQARGLAVGRGFRALSPKNVFLLRCLLLPLLVATYERAIEFWITLCLRAPSSALPNRRFVWNAANMLTGLVSIAIAALAFV